MSAMRVKRRDFPVWVATLATFAAAGAIWLIGGEQFWDDGYGVMLFLLTTVAICWLCRWMTFNIYGTLVLVSLSIGAVKSLFDIDGLAVDAVGGAFVLATAYAVGDRPRRSQAPGSGPAVDAEPSESVGDSTRLWYDWPLVQMVGAAVVAYALAVAWVSVT